jgi:hypothetical protein
MHHFPKHLLAVPLSLVFAIGCGEKKNTDKKEETTKVVEPAPKAPELPTTMAASQHTGGMERFRDPAVYVDGKPLGVLRFGEMPKPLEVVWFKEKAALPFKKGQTGPRHKIIEQRRYRFRDYFEAMGLDLKKIKEMHLYGGNRKAAAVVIPGESLRKFDDLLFRFGGAIWGKPLPSCPPNVGDGKCPDQIGTVTVYIDKEPPKRVGGHFAFEDGEIIQGIPYLGEPIRGGVRVYFDGPLAATIKRKYLKALDMKPSGPEGKESYSFFEFLKLQGVDTDKVTEAWLIHYERHVKKLTREELLNARFRAGEAGSGEILLGAEETPTHIISLHSKPVPKSALPVLRSDEIEKADG